MSQGHLLHSLSQSWDPPFVPGDQGPLVGNSVSKPGSEHVTVQPTSHSHPAWAPAAQPGFQAPYWSANHPPTPRKSLYTNVHLTSLELDFSGKGEKRRRKKLVKCWVLRYFIFLCFLVVVLTWKSAISFYRWVFGLVIIVLVFLGG